MGVILSPGGSVFMKKLGQFTMKIYRCTSSIQVEGREVANDL